MRKRQQEIEDEEARIREKRRLDLMLEIELQQKLFDQKSLQQKEESIFKQKELNYEFERNQLFHRQRSIEMDKDRDDLEERKI